MLAPAHRSVVKLVLALLAISVILHLPAGVRATATSNEALAPVTIGMERTLVNGLLYIADERGFFTENGIRLTIDDHFPSGAAAATAMLKGTIDLSTAAELVLVRNAFEEKNIRALASIDMFTHMKLLARRDLGINSAEDLAGKKIGVPLKTAADFKLDRFLKLHKIDRDQVALIDVQAPDGVAALTSARVDALVTWHPYVMELQESLGDCLVLDVQNSQPMYCLLLTMRQWLKDSPELLSRLMRALLQAENYVFTREPEAKELLGRRLGYSSTYLDSIWQQHRLSLRLDQSLILALEDQARWVIETGLTTKHDSPDFIRLIDIDTLNEVKPEAVSVIR